MGESLMARGRCRRLVIFGDAHQRIGGITQKVVVGDGASLDDDGLGRGAGDDTITNYPRDAGKKVLQPPRCGVAVTLVFGFTSCGVGLGPED